MSSKIPFHPILLAIFPVLSYWLVNKDFVPFQDAWRALGVCAAAALLFQALFTRLLHSPHRGAFLASLIIVTVLYFGRGYSLLAGSRSNEFLPGVFLAAWITLFLFGSILILRQRKDHPILTYSLNVFAILLLIAPLYGTARALGEQQAPRRTTSGDFPGQDSVAPAGSRLPDIYYIILDSYGRGDVLAELYGLDNSEFLDALQERGFYVADESHANYIQTPLSLGSSLNAGYFDPAQFTPGSTDRTGFQTYLNETPDLKTLHRMGYEIVGSRDAIDFLQLDVADRSLAIDHYFNSFELGFNQTTLNFLWTSNLYEYKLWQLTRAQLDELESPWLASGPPHFVFTHILSPHPPFSFDAQGNFVPTSMAQISSMNIPEGGRAEYISGYRTQVQYLNTRLIKIINHIQSRPDRPAIILLQGDHGPGAYLDRSSAANTCLRERFSILNAYYFPDTATRDRLYPGISPVNSFRLVFGELLGQSIPLLEDRSYYSTWEKPYEFLDVTDARDTCSPLTK